MLKIPNLLPRSASRWDIFQNRLEFLRQEAERSAFISVNAVKGEAQKTGAHGGSREALEIVRVIGEAALAALPVVIESYDIAVKRGGVRQLELQRLTRLWVSQFLTTADSAWSRTGAWPTDDQVFVANLHDLGWRLTQRLEQHFDGSSTQPTRWTDRHPLLKELLFVVISAACGALFTLLATAG